MLFLINFRLQYEGAPKYLGESVTGLEFGIWNWWDGPCVAVGNIEIGQYWCWQMHRWAGVALLHMHNFFAAKGGKQMIVTSFSDVTNILLTHRVGGYISRVCMSLEAIIWVFGAEHSGKFLRSHQPSVVATSVPLMGARVHSYRTVFLVYSSTCAQGYLGHP